MVPILLTHVRRPDGRHDRLVSILSFRDMIYNISEKWLSRNSDPSEWVGGKAAMDQWDVAHLKYLIENPFDIGAVSRKLHYSDFIKNNKVDEVYVDFVERSNSASRRRRKYKKKNTQKEAQQNNDDKSRSSSRSRRRSKSAARHSSRSASNSNDDNGSKKHQQDNKNTLGDIASDSKCTTTTRRRGSGSRSKSGHRASTRTHGPKFDKEQQSKLVAGVAGDSASQSDGAGHGSKSRHNPTRQRPGRSTSRPHEQTLEQATCAARPRYRSGSRAQSREKTKEKEKREGKDEGGGDDDAEEEEESKSKSAITTQQQRRNKRDQSMTTADTKTKRQQQHDESNSSREQTAPKIAQLSSGADSIGDATNNDVVHHHTRSRREKKTKSDDTRGEKGADDIQSSPNNNNNNNDTHASKQKEKRGSDDYKTKKSKRTNSPVKEAKQQKKEEDTKNITTTKEREAQQQQQQEPAEKPHQERGKHESTSRSHRRLRSRSHSRSHKKSGHKHSHSRSRSHKRSHGHEQNHSINDHDNNHRNKRTRARTSDDTNNNSHNHTHTASTDANVDSKSPTRQSSQNQHTKKNQMQPLTRQQQHKAKTTKAKTYDDTIFQPKYPYQDDVVIRESTIPNAGRGVFAKVDMRKDSVIGRYSGKIISHSEFTKMPKARANKVIAVRLPTGKDVLIDGEGAHHYSAFFNHKWDVDGDPMGAANIAITEEGWFRCKRDISAGEELFFNYGVDYWIWHRYNVDVDEIKDTEKRLKAMMSILKDMPN